MWALGDYISSWSSEPSTPSTSLVGSVPSRPDHPYLRGWSFDRELPELVDDIRVPFWAYDFFDKLPAGSRPPFHWIFLGPASTHTPLHVDPLLTHAWLAQVRPSRASVPLCSNNLADPWSKIFYHFPASRPPLSFRFQRVRCRCGCPSFLFPNRCYQGIASHQTLQVCRFSFARYITLPLALQGSRPTFTLLFVCQRAHCGCLQATPLEVLLQPGDILFVPRFWPHRFLSPPTFHSAPLSPRAFFVICEGLPTQSVAVFERLTTASV